ncbi:hypothetical protein [Ktedonobacter robiniae]|uniref:GH18 domain-containing protein n=1 Tax=Ktedonobacter robiniae TaxID=2778365 RepID=A0ABQ3UZU5_9CHLR|nr:hypothetical protein [Ktedonobacter robiniae]GHO58379.1 hypothetical protein KSB_68540 [Ktedonobacter robiniae]
MRKFPRVLALFFSCVMVLSGIVAATTIFSKGIPRAYAASALPSSYFAPYAETGVGASLQSVTQSTEQKYYTLAFITASGCSPVWDGYVPINNTSSDLPTLTSDISYIRSQGGDVIISFGGASGQELAQACTSASSLQAQYQAVINQYSASHLDFDIEGGEEGDATTYTRRNTALAALQQANPGLTISFTLPSGTTGLEPAPAGHTGSLDLLKDAISKGVNFSVVNLMTMDYGSPDSQMGQEAINAANGLHAQLQQMFPSKTSSQLWSMVGITAMIGQNDTPGEIFTQSNASQVLSFAQANQIGELAFWAVSRDNGSCPGRTTPTSDTCDGLSQSNYAFTNLWKPFTSGSSSPTPTPTGTPPSIIGKTIWLQATNNNNFVSARNDQTNIPLQATSTQVQAWEEFDVIDAGNGLIALRSHANNNYVSTRISQTNVPLQATATQVQGWEQFRWLPQSNGTVALQSAANNNYVSARTDQTNTPLDATATQVQAWEQFNWGLATPPIGKTIWLQATNNNNYVSAHTDQTNTPLQATATQVQGWEQFDVVDAGNGLIALLSHANNNYVSARISQTNAPLQATATQVQGWEQFNWVLQNNGTVALQSVANNNYISARTDQTNTPLDATATQAQAWEQFRWGQVG